MAQPSVHGRFIWQELLTEDTAAAAAFYAKVIGWRVRASQHPTAHNYSVFATDQGAVGGVTSLPDHARDAGARPHWLPYIGAENVDATAAKAERLGGRILRAATDVEELGRYAVLADPQGATFGIYRPKSPSGSTTKSQPQRGEFAWQELASSDFEAGFRFYADLFGWQALQRMEMGPAGTYLIFGRDGVQQGGMYKLSSQMPAPYWLSYIEVADTEAAVESARAAGGRVTVEPMDVPGGGRIAQLLDAGGVLFAVHTAGHAAAVTGAGTSAAQTDSAKAEGAKPSARRPAKSTDRPARRVTAGAKSVPASESRASPRPGAKKSAKKAKSARSAKKAKKASGKRAAKKSAGKTQRRAAGKSARRGERRSARSARAKAPAKSGRSARAGRAGGRRVAAKRGRRSAAGSGRGRGRAARRR